jgi:Fe2+ transport system protein FeoA
VTLDLLPVGKNATIVSVGGEGALRCRLLDMGLIPKTKVKVRKVAPMGDPIELEIRGYELTLRKDDARQIEITESGED